MEFQTINLDMIDPNPNQPRKDFGDDNLQELADSIKQVGVLVPLLVRPLDGRYEIVHGERRWRAAKMAGLDQVPARVQPLTDTEAFIISLNENLQRQNLNPIEEAKAYSWLQDQGYIQADIGKIIGKTQQYVASRLTLLQLSQTVQEKITTHVVTPTHGEILVGLKDQRLQEVLAKKVEKESMPTKTLTGWVELLKELPVGSISERQHHELTKVIVKATVPAEARYKLYQQLQESNKESSFFGKHSELLHYREAVAMGELKIPYYGSKLEVVSLKRLFTGQQIAWPRYSGMEKVLVDVGGIQVMYDSEGIDVFSEEEWAEVTDYNMSDLDRMFPDLCFDDVKRDSLRIFDDPITRRTYEHNYGHFLLTDAHKKVKAMAVNGHVIYIRQGWGRWVVVSFNDGQGKRIRRKYFAQDYYDNTLVELAFKAANPGLFTDEDYRQLSIHQVQRYEMSWFYLRKETRSKKEVIKALAADLKRLNSLPAQLSSAEIQAKALELLKEWHFVHPGPGGFREGRVSERRLPDGSVDMGQYKNVRA